jgi:hypothetical protein
MNRLPLFKRVWVRYNKSGKVSRRLKVNLGKGRFGGGGETYLDHSKGSDSLEDV